MLKRKSFQLNKRRTAAVTAGGTGLVASTGAHADVAADAVTEIGKLTTAVGTISPAILTVVGAIVVVGIVIMLMKKS